MNCEECRPGVVDPWNPDGDGVVVKHGHVECRVEVAPADINIYPTTSTGAVLVNALSESGGVASFR